MKVKHIVAAQPGWVSRFRDPARADRVIERPIAVWAIIVDKNGDELISGFSGPQAFYLPDHVADNFLGFYYKNDS